MLSTNYEITGMLFWKKIHYECPHCHTNLVSPFNDVGDTMTCPDCEKDFLVPGGDTDYKERNKFDEKLFRDLVIRNDVRVEHLDRIVGDILGPPPSRTPEELWGETGPSQLIVVDVYKKSPTFTLFCFKFFERQGLFPGGQFFRIYWDYIESHPNVLKGSLPLDYSSPLERQIKEELRQKLLRGQL